MEHWTLPIKLCYRRNQNFLSSSFISRTALPDVIYLDFWFGILSLWITSTTISFPWLTLTVRVANWRKCAKTKANRSLDITFVYGFKSQSVVSRTLMTSSEAKFFNPCMTKNSAGKQWWKYTRYSSYWHMLQLKKILTAKYMEETLPSAPSARNQVNKVHQKRHQKPKDKPKPRLAHDEKRNNTCQFCGLDHKGPRSQCPASGKTCGSCSKKGSFRLHV